jgi:hypothetical protein
MRYCLLLIAATVGGLTASSAALPGPRQARLLAQFLAPTSPGDRGPAKSVAASLAKPVAPPPCQGSPPPSQFLVFGGGGAPSYNEVAIEKNVLYFQRTLKALSWDPQQAKIWFANGNDGQKTVRYLDPQGNERFKAPSIPNLAGPATLANFQQSIRSLARAQPIVKTGAPTSAQTSAQTGSPLFFYFTGHGHRNEANFNNNAMVLWQEKQLDVQQFTQLLDQLPQQTPVVTVMVQCFSGAFANMIYEQGDPQRPVSLKTRCGFFATVKERPSVGCTAEVNEADYRDYSSSFFAGLSGISRTGQKVASADYNRDGHVAYIEAHAFAKIDEQASDLPLSTSESWLQAQLSQVEGDRLLKGKPIGTLLSTARPDQRAVVAALAQRFHFDQDRSFAENLAAGPDPDTLSEVDQTFLTRLSMELVNIGAEAQVRAQGNPAQLALLDRLLNCESGSWSRSASAALPVQRP